MSVNCRYRANAKLSIECKSNYECEYESEYFIHFVINSFNFICFQKNDENKNII